MEQVQLRSYLSNTLAGRSLITRSVAPGASRITRTTTAASHITKAVHALSHLDAGVRQ